ncbi:MAG: tRNA pseudouridine synthase A [bacterium]
MLYNYLVILSYIGFDYAGWQIQKNIKTVQGEITKTLEEILEIKIEKSSYTGRTDRGVSALFQYFNFFCSKNLNITQDIVDQINQRLPFEIFVLDFKKVSPSFSSRYNVKFKQYIYKLVILTSEENRIHNYGLRNFYSMGKIEKDVVLQKLNNFIPLFNGKKDYSSYYKSEKEVRKNTFINLETNYFIYEFFDFTVVNLEFKAAYFLRNMIRKIVGMLLAYLEDKINLEYIKDSLENPCPSKGKFLAPSEPLVLFYAKY